MPDQQIENAPERLDEVLADHPEPDLNDQGEIAADDAGATALAERVANAAGAQAGDESET